MTSVFISYTTKDIEIAREIALFLVAENINVFFAEWTIAPGQSLVQSVNKGLESATHLLLLWSESAAKSQWVEREWGATVASALNSKIITVIPIKLDGTPLPGLLSDLKYIKYGGGSEDDRRSIVEAVTGEAPSANLIRAVLKKYEELVYDPDDPSPLPFQSLSGMRKHQTSPVLDRRPGRLLASD